MAIDGYKDRSIFFLSGDPWSRRPVTALSALLMASRPYKPLDDWGESHGLLSRNPAP